MCPLNYAVLFSQEGKASINFSVAIQKDMATNIETLNNYAHIYNSFVNDRNAGEKFLSSNKVDSLAGCFSSKKT